MRQLSLFITLILGVMFTFGNIPGAYAKKSSGSYYRSAKTGKFVTPTYGKSHPSTTVKSRYK